MRLTTEQIVAIHEMLAERFASTENPMSPPGIKDLTLLESAVARPYQSAGGADSYRTPFDKAAALFHSLINNHPFHNGNKRVALISAQVQLADDGFWLESCTDDEMYEFTRKAAAHELTEMRSGEADYISGWLESNSRKVQRGEHPLKFHALKHILRRFGFEMDDPSGPLINIYKNEKVVERISKQGIHGFRPYHTDYIWGLRKRLGLVPENGIDSVKFYGGKGVVETASQFVDLRIEVINNLAKT